MRPRGADRVLKGPVIGDYGQLLGIGRLPDHFPDPFVGRPVHAENDLYGRRLNRRDRARAAVKNQGHPVAAAAVGLRPFNLPDQRQALLVNVPMQEFRDLVQNVVPVQKIV